MRGLKKKNCLGFLILIIFLFTNIGVCNDLGSGEIVITNPSRWDGFGSQFQTIIYTAIYAELCNKHFVYSPFEKIEHNYAQDPEFIRKKEWLINFIGNFEIKKEEKISRMNAGESVRFFENNLDACENSQVLKRIKQVFRANKKREKYFLEGNLHVAVHVRRRNSCDNRIAGTNIPDFVYLEVINQLRSSFSNTNPLFHIYSQGSISDFQSVYLGGDIILHINENIEDTFTGMVLADVLVTSASSFSYTAALLSDGIVYYMPFWHPPLSKWMLIK